MDKYDLLNIIITAACFAPFFWRWHKKRAAKALHLKIYSAVIGAAKPAEDESKGWTQAARFMVSNNSKQPVMMTHYQIIVGQDVKGQQDIFQMLDPGASPYTAEMILQDVPERKGYVTAELRLYVMGHKKPVTHMFVVR